MEELYRKIEEICPCVRAADMKKYTTFKVGGPADLLAQPESREQLMRVLALCKDAPHAVIGNGSNLLVGDGGFRGVIIRIGSNLSAISVEGNRIFAEAGATLSAVAHAAMRAALSGMAPLAGIPGTVGGAVLMNAGAYGGEIADVCESVSAILPSGEVREFREHAFSYRHSIYQENGAIITNAVFSLTPGSREDILRDMEELAQKRREKQPLTLPSAGSAFRRPKEGYAAQMIDEAGLRGYAIGDAAVSEKHAGFVVNYGNATAKDIRALLAYVESRVRETHGVKLEPEIRFLGEFI